MVDQVRSIVWADAGGYTVVTKVRSATGAAGIMADALAVSNADWLEDWEGALSTHVATPTSAVYQPASLRAVLTFLCADNSQVRLIVPSPQVGIFLADKQTVDAANAGVVTLIAACIGNLESATGSLATAYLSGTLVSIPL